jgi:hypothetical protein
MKRHGEALVEIDADDQRFAKRLAEAYAPEPLTAQRRVSFTRALEARLEGHGRRPRLVPVLGGALLAAAVAWLVLPRGPVPEPAGQAARVEASRGTGQGSGEASWELELLYPETQLGDEWQAHEDPLPAEYLAIASAFLDG